MKSIACWLSVNIISVILYMFITLFVLYCIGYFGNGLFNCKFDLSSIWVGVAAIFSTGIIGFIPKVLEYQQYKLDSLYNSPTGMPCQLDQSNNAATNHDKINN